MKRQKKKFLNGKVLVEDRASRVLKMVNLNPGPYNLPPD
jgi:hypothetical protein